jgi:type II secretory pathway predicted ATPase ExeA
MQRTTNDPSFVATVEILGSEGTEKVATIRETMRHMMNEKAWCPVVLILEESSITLISSANAIFLEERAHEKERVSIRFLVCRSDSSTILNKERIGAGQHVLKYKHERWHYVRSN